MSRSPRNTREIQFRYVVERHGRVGRIKFWPNRGIYGTYFHFAGRSVRNSFKTFEGAYEYLIREFSKLDTEPHNSSIVYPIRGDLRTYHELEMLLKERTGGKATLREAVDFYLAHHEHAGGDGEYFAGVYRA